MNDSKTVWRIDLPMEDFQNMAASNDLRLYALLEWLRGNWIGDSPERLRSCRMGMMKCSVDSDSMLNMDFKVRFQVPGNLLSYLDGLIEQNRSIEQEIGQKVDAMCDECAGPHWREEQGK